jgi:hypothetical protein
MAGAGGEMIVTIHAGFIFTCFSLSITRYKFERIIIDKV